MISHHYYFIINRKSIIMLAKLLRNLRDLTITTTIFATGAYGYIYYKAKENQERYLQSIKSQTLRDASRMSNDSFGISWGFQADDTIMSRIDSGDLLFLKYECEECLTPESMIKCYLKTSHFLDEEYQSLGCAFRDESNLYVLFNEFGETKAKTYCELVSLPYIRELTLQKLGSRYELAHKNLRKQVDLEKIILEDSLTFANRINKILGFSNILKYIQELMSSQQKINIRTATNRKLSSL